MIEKLAFDSNCFDLNIGKLTLVDNNQDLDLKDNEFDLIYVFSKDPVKRLDNFLVDTKVVLSIDLKEKNLKIENPNNKIKSYSKDSKSYEDLLDLAFLSGEFSRFKLDQNLPNSSFSKLYKIWLDESINKRIANDVVIYSDPANPEKPLGFITYRLNESLAEIGLISVSQFSQGKGIGKELLDYLSHVAITNNIKEIKVATQEKNTGAMKFYKKYGFNIQSKTFIYHLWPKKYDLTDL
jgi:dTDP-4-amino-4,6-dideoxy-D-galactose acyltransferase